MGKKSNSKLLGNLLDSLRSKQAERRSEKGSNGMEKKKKGFFRESYWRLAKVKSLGSRGIRDLVDTSCLNKQKKSVSGTVRGD